MTWKSLLKGTFAATIVMPPTTAIYWLLFVSFSPTDALEAAASIGLFAMANAAFVTPVYGVPLFLILRRFQVANFWTCLGAAIFPWLIQAALATQPPPPYKMFIFHSIVGALAFWFFARRVRKPALGAQQIAPPAT